MTEDIEDQINRVRNVDTAAAVSVPGDQWYRRGPAREDVGEDIDYIGDVNPAVVVGIANNQSESATGLVSPH